MRIQFDGLALIPTILSIIIMLALNSLETRATVFTRNDEDLFLTSSASIGRVGIHPLVGGAQAHRFFIFGALVSALAIVAWSIILAIVRLIPKDMAGLGLMSILSNCLILLRYN
jgi:hypothetical protein